MTSQRTRSRSAARRLLLAGALLALPAVAAGQDGFLFQPPSGGLTVRMGPMLHTATGDIFEELRRELTLDRKDFRGFAGNAELGIVLLSRLDLVLGGGYSHTAPRSEFRDWVDQDGEAIEQRTRLQVVPMTAGLRYLPLSRGRSITSNAWLPASTTPYVGAGGGATWFRLRQDGEFVDFRDFRIFTNVIETKGFTPSAYALVGVDQWLSAQLGLNAEARYTHARATPNQGFHSFDRLDLGGFQAAVGLTVRW